LFKRPIFFKTGLSIVGFAVAGFGSETTGAFTVSAFGTISLGVFFFAGESAWKKVAGIM
jgi:hypothetical protein